jgi:hypothetical protein
MGEVISLRVRNQEAGSYAPKVAGQIETPRPPDPIMRRPRADREEKRVTLGKDIRQEEQLDANNPNQRRLSENMGSSPTHSGASS